MFTPKDLECHLREAKAWNEVQDSFDSIQCLVERDGWTHQDV